MNPGADLATLRRMAFSDRLRALLSQSGRRLEPIQLARVFSAHAGYSIQPQSFSNWLNGVQMPQRGNLLALAAWLNTTAEALTDGTPILHFAPAKTTDVETQQLIAHFQQLDASGRGIVLATVAAAARLKGGL